jgi:ATP synthase protein I
VMPFHRPIPESKSRNRSSFGLGSLVEAEKLMQIAMVLPSAVFIGWLVGSWLDHRLHHSWMTLTGIMLGCISGLYFVIQTAVAAERAINTDDAGRSGTGKESSEKES